MRACASATKYLTKARAIATPICRSWCRGAERRSLAVRSQLHDAHFHAHLLRRLWPARSQLRCMMRTEFGPALRYAELVSHRTQRSHSHSHSTRNVASRKCLVPGVGHFHIESVLSPSPRCTSWTHEEAQFRWPRSIKKSAQTYIYQIKALEQLNKAMSVPFRQSGLRKKYGTKHVFWDSSG